jgi:hypothetical protein
MRAILAAAALFAVFACDAGAHKASDGYLVLETRGEAVHAKLDLALRDLDLGVGLDPDGDGLIRWGEVRTHEPSLFAYVLSRVGIAGPRGDCPSQPVSLRVDRRSDGAYAVLDFVARCGTGNPATTLRYRVLHDVDPLHRGLVRVVDARGSEQGLVLSADANTTTFADDRSPLSRASGFLREGIHHIATGYDHLAFLVLLLLPAVLVRQDGRWTPATSFGAAAVGVAKTVTAFTAAHSVTLALSALDVVRLPGRLVESAIALSIVLAAIDNVTPVVRRRWAVAFGFGLVHGFGFAGALGEIGLGGTARVVSLAAFNLGVEAGQLAIVMPLIALAWYLRERPQYSRWVLQRGSIAFAALGALWLVERSLDVQLALPF